MRRKKNRIPEPLNPLVWLRWSGQFLHKWFLTMPRSSIGTALPSLIAAVVLVGGTVFAMTRSSTWRSQRILQGLHDAMARSDHAEVELLAQRLLRDDPEDVTLQFQLANARSQGDQRDAALDTMRRLASDRRYVPAARWLLSEEFSPLAWAEWDAAKRGKFGALMEIAVDTKTTNPQMVALYADYLIASDAAEKAIPYLESLSEKEPARALQAAAIHRKTGNESRAEILARRGLRKLERLTVEEPTNVDLYLGQTRFLLFLRRYEDAARLLKRGLDITEDERLRQAAVETLVVWSHDPPEKKDETLRLAQRLSLLRQAIQLAPQNQLVIQTLIPLVLETAADDSPRVAQVRQLLLNGVTPDLGHFIRGTAAVINGDIEEATFHLELAAKQMPHAPSVLNNLAVLLGRREGEDREKALQLINVAIEQKADEPFFHETRGQILLKMGRYEDAIASLERALPAKKLAVPIHRGLAEAYGKLGKEQIASEHEQLAKQAEKAAAEER